MKLRFLAARGYLQNLGQINDLVRGSAMPSQHDVNVYKGELYAVPLSTSTQYYQLQPLAESAGGGSSAAETTSPRR